jgi:hypothetical protein
MPGLIPWESTNSVGPVGTPGKFFIRRHEPLTNLILITRTQPVRQIMQENIQIHRQDAPPLPPPRQTTMRAGEGSQP